MTEAAAKSTTPAVVADGKPQLTETQARRLTERIKKASSDLWRLLKESHDKEAWRTLGYESWIAYVEVECGLAKSHAYRLLRHASVVSALESATDSPAGEWLSERDTRDLNPEKVTKALTAELAARPKEAPATVVKDVISNVRAVMADAKPKAKLDHLTRAATLLMDAVDLIRRSGIPQSEYEEVEPLLASVLALREKLTRA